MATTNPVFQVLTPSGNQALLAAGSRTDALANGQIGIFNYHTGLSVDGSVPGDCKDIFICVGINRTLGGTNTAEDIQRSAGQVIQVRHTRAWTVKGYMAEVPKVMEISGFKAYADRPYGVKIEYRNQKSYLVNGYTPLAKTYDATTSISQSGAIEGSNGELAELIVNAINADPDKLVTASAFAYQITGTVSDPSTDGTAVVTVGTESFSVALLAADTPTTAAAKIAAAINAVSTSAYTASSAVAALFVFPKVSAATGSTTATIAVGAAGGTGLTITSVTAANANISNTTTFRAANPNAGFAVRITGVTDNRVGGNNDINIKYNGVGTDFLISLVYGFEGVGKVTTITELQYVEGKGYDLKQLEYQAGGWNGKPGPYRQSETTGLARDGYEYFINPAANYNVISLAYDQQSVGGWLEYLNNLETIFAIPCADTTTLTGLVAVLDLIFTQFPPMTNDVASMNCSNTRTGLLTAATDGVESLS